MSLEAEGSSPGVKAMQLVHELQLYLHSMEQDNESQQGHVSTMPSHHEHLDDETWQSLDVILCDLVQTVRKLRNHVNPIHYLPPELWAIISSMVPTPRWPETSPASPFSRSTRLVNISHVVPLAAVCRLWRQIALSTPSLWSTILDTGKSKKPVFWSHYAHRCTAGPFFFEILDTPSHETIALLQKERTRVRELIYYSHRRSMHQYHPRLPQLFSYPLPNLTFCGLFLFLTTSALLSAGQRQCISLPDHHLLTLTLCGVYISSTMDLTALTHLKLFKVCCMLPDELLEVLARTPRLEELVLRKFETVMGPGEGSGSAGRDNAPLPPIELPALRLVSASRPLFLSYDNEEYYFNFLQQVLSQLVYPRACEVVLQPVRMGNLLPLIDVILRDKQDHLGVCVYLPIDAPCEELLFSASPTGKYWRYLHCDITIRDIGSHTEL
ncbi:hypothetical protein GY45DRAFT_16599 [Cubamyces sp. BRFM 1775]|nr:hypothetical protein GY45DRAFT_16599 [Cubamyces sp. BRFM 1775]